MKQKTCFFMGIISLLAIASLVNPVVAKSPTPAQSEASVVLSYYSPYNSEYKIADSLISGYTVDLIFFEALRDATKLDLAKSVWESNFATIVNNEDYSLTMGNNTWDTATSDGMTVNTQATCNAPETLVTFKATTNATAVAQYASAYSYFGYDGNDDGDYSDVADKGYLPHDENLWITVNNEMTTSSTDTSTYSLVNIAFETTTTTDYTISIKYWYTSGDSGWDFSTANGATLEFFDCSGDPIVTTICLADVLDADTSEDVNIIGSDSYRQYLYCDEASKYVQNELKNIAYFSSIPAFTDDNDGDNDWDMDGSDEYFSGIDQTDYLFTVVTQDTTDTYDSDQELLADHNDIITTKVKARYLYFTGTMGMYPSSYSYGSSSTGVSDKYLTTETLSFDTRVINDFDALSNVLSWSTWKFNVTLEDSVMWDTDHYENNLYYFSWEGIDQTETFRGVWTTTTDDSEVQYDNSDPSATTGSLDDVSLQYYTAKSYSYTEETTVTTTTVSPGGGTTSETTSDPTGLLVLIGLIGGSALVIYLWKKR